MRAPTNREIEEANKIHLEMFGFRSLECLASEVGPSLGRYVRLIQRCARGFLARAKVANLREERIFGSFLLADKQKKALVTDTLSESDSEYHSSTSAK